MYLKEYRKILDILINKIKNKYYKVFISHYDKLIMIYKIYQMY